MKYVTIVVTLILLSSCIALIKAAEEERDVGKRLLIDSRLLTAAYTVALRNETALRPLVGHWTGYSKFGCVDELLWTLDVKGGGSDEIYLRAQPAPGFVTFAFF